MAADTIEQNQGKYRSRKFLVTLAGLATGIVMAYLGKLTPELSNIVLAAIASYNIANAFSRNA